MRGLRDVAKLLSSITHLEKGRETVLRGFYAYSLIHDRIRENVFRYYDLISNKARRTMLRVGYTQGEISLESTRNDFSCQVVRKYLVELSQTNTQK